MPAWFKKLRAALAAKQNRVFIWTCLFFAAFGALQLGDSIDDLLRIVRDAARTRAASSEIALILPDDPSQAGGTNWSWSRTDLAQLVSRLRAAGAERVAIARLIPEKGAAPDNLASELALMPKRSIVAARFDVNPETGERKVIHPPSDLAKVADTAIINLYFDAFGRVKTVPYQVGSEGKTYRSLVSYLANKTGATDELAPIDYAIDITSVPLLNARSFQGNAKTPNLLGKIVVIASTESSMNTRRLGRVSSAYAHILGAETLSHGHPRSLGWMPAFSVALIAAALIWFGRRRVAMATAIGAIAALLVVPLFLEAELMFADTTAGLLLIPAIVAIRSYRSYRREGTRENSLSGLPNLAALKERHIEANDAIVVAKIANYAELVSVVSFHEKLLAEQVASRISAGGGMSLFHGDGGIFAWIVPATAVEGLGDHLDALHAFFLKPITVGPWQVDVTPAFGIDIAAGKDMSACFACASVAADDVAEHHLRWKFYEPARLGEAEWNISLLGKLDAAIASGEVWVAYQPKIDIASGKVTGFEALARWTHSERGAISPEQFIAIAESNDRIDGLTYFVLEQALSMLAGLGPDHQALGLAVNASIRMFDRKDFVPKVRDALKRHGIAPARLTLEITESAAAESEKSLLACVAGLARLGVQVSIDDYGTGYSTLEYLKKLDANELKIDRGFVAGMDRNRSDYLLVKATIDLAHNLGHRVVAEGVETPETLAMLSKLGCDAAQGFLIARPMPQAEVQNYLAQADERRAA